MIFGVMPTPVLCRLVMRYFGILAKRQLATVSTQAARSRSISPRCKKKRKMERSAVTMSLALPGLIVGA
jgi:hypothetical protein